jgi:hypothetical protein
MIVKKKKSRRKKSKKEKKLKDESVKTEKDQSSDDEPLFLKHGNLSSRSLPSQVSSPIPNHSQSNVYLPPSTTAYMHQTMAQQQMYAPAMAAPTMQRLPSKSSQSSSKKTKKSKRERTQSESGSSNSTKLSGSVSKGSLRSSESRKSRQSFQLSQQGDLSMTSAELSARPPSRMAPIRPDEDDEDEKPLAVVKDKYQTKPSNELSRAGSRKSVSFPAEPVSETKFVKPVTSMSDVSQNAVAHEPQSRTSSLKKKKKGLFQRILCCFNGSNDEALSPSPVEADLGLRRTVSVASYRSLDPKSNSDYSIELSSKKSLNFSDSSRSFDPKRASMMDIELPHVRTSPFQFEQETNRTSLDSLDLGKGLDDIMAKYMSPHSTTNSAGTRAVPLAGSRPIPKSVVSNRKSMDLELDEELLQYKSMF